MGQREYENKQIMTVTALPLIYRNLAYEQSETFFETVHFHKMNKKENRGENDVSAIVLDKSSVQCADCINIRNTNCSWSNWKRAFGYYELDNALKYSIFQKPT